MNTILAPLAPVGRLMLCGIFLMSAIAGKIMDFNGTVEKMTAEGVPMPQVMLVGAIVFLIAGSLSVIFGIKGRVGALLLLVFLILATFYFHDFWTFEGERAQQEMGRFLSNTALAGAMVFIIANGSGPLSVDRYLQLRPKKKKQ